MKTAAAISHQGLVPVVYPLLVAFVIIGYVLIMVLVAIASLLTMKSAIPKSSQTFEAAALNVPREGSR